MNKEIIKEKLFTKTNKINSAILRQEWFKKTALFTWINEKIQFTDDISEKIFCILHDITEHPKCPSCQKELTFKTFQDGYSRFCNKKACSRKHVIWKSSGVKKKTYNNIILNFIDIYQNNKFNLLNPYEFIVSRKLTTENGIKNQWVNLKILKEYIDELCSIIQITQNIIPFDPVKRNFQWSERFYLIYNNLTEKPKCVICNNPCNGYNGFIKGYSKCCSDICTNLYGIKNKIENKYDFIEEKLKTQDFTLLTNFNEFLGVNKTKVELKCNKCGKITTKDLSDGKSSNVYCSGCYGDIGISKGEKEIAEFIKSLNFTIIENSKTIIPPKELDIYIPEKAIGIEYDGIHWHSETINQDKNYHINKTNCCKEKGVQLLHIFDYEWLTKQAIVKSIIKSKLGLYDNRYFARNCTIKEIDTKAKRLFLEENHIQGNDNSRLAYGLFKENELLAVMTFGVRQITRGKSEWELMRFCNKINTQIVGGASKLLKHFETNNSISELKTYADLRYCFTPDFYIKLGFNLKHISRPNYWYFKNNGIFHRINFQKHKLKQKLKFFNPDLTEYDNMRLNGFDRIWDCGNYVFIKQTKKFTPKQ